MSQALSPRRPSAGAAIFAGARLARQRLPLRALVPIAVLALAFSAAIAVLERAHAPLNAPDRVVDAVLGIVTPLVALALVTLVCGGERLGDALWPLARYGIARRQLALGLILSAIALTVIIVLLVLGLALWIGYGPMPGLANDALTCAWIAAAGAAAYVAWFAVGASVFRLGRGRWAVLALDLTLGSGLGILAAAWPRAHLRNLVGGAAVMDLPQASSSVALLASAVVLTVVAALLAGD